MAGLQDFWIYNNHIKRIPDSIGKCKILKRFWFDNNQISEIPETIGDCAELEQLYGSCNRLTKLPMTLVDCAKLDKLAIDGNPVEVLESVPAKLRGKLVNGKPGEGQSVPARPSIAPASTTAAVERSYDALAEHMAPSTLRDHEVDGHVYVEAVNYASNAKRLSTNAAAPRRGLFRWLKAIF
uniref:Uncharacterized protein n=1 Tax=Tetraselmis chuii TaxID=63592 RepID=A0A6U1KJZ0_9CHLO